VTRVLLRRHGTADEVGRAPGGRAAIPLNDEGRRQAARLAGRLERVPLRAIYTGPRTEETDEAVARRHGLAINDTAGPPWS
jgi:probable phosphoglycerate mutase